MTEEQEKFPEKAVSHLANKLEEMTVEKDGPMNQREAMALFKSIAEISKYYDIPKEDRTEFAVVGMRRVLNRQVESTISDFREQLEGMEGIWG